MRTLFAIPRNGGLCKLQVDLGGNWENGSESLRFALDLMVEMAIIGACAFEQHLEK